MMFEASGPKDVQNVIIVRDKNLWKIVGVENVTIFCVRIMLFVWWDHWRGQVKDYSKSKSRKDEMVKTLVSLYSSLLKNKNLGSFCSTLLDVPKVIFEQWRFVKPFFWRKNKTRAPNGKNVSRCQKFILWKWWKNGSPCFSLPVWKMFVVFYPHYM